MIQTAKKFLVIIPVVLLVGCSSKKNLEGSVYYREAQIIEQKVAVRCSIEQCREPQELPILRATIDNRKETYIARATALRLYRPLLEAYAQCLKTQLQLCTAKPGEAQSTTTKPKQ